MPFIYAFCSPEDKNNTDVIRTKVGYTTKNAEDRIHSFQLPFIPHTILIKEVKDITDKDVFKIFKKRRYTKDREEKEWFNIPLQEEKHIKEILEECIEETINKTEKFFPPEEEIKTFKYTKIDPLTFFEIPGFPCQRNVEARKDKLCESFLEGGFIETMLDVAIVRFPDGTEMKVNGHTRAKLFEDGDLPIPPHLIVRIHEVDSMEEAEKLYYSYDNATAAEKRTHIMQGIFNKEGLNLVSEDAVRAKGLGKPLEFASRNNKELNVPNASTSWDKEDLIKVIKYFRNEIETLDKHGLIEAFVAPQKCAALMLLKKHSHTNERLLLGLTNLRDEIRGAGTKDIKDPIGFLIDEWSSHKILGTYSTDEHRFPFFIDCILWAFHQWMEEGMQITVKEYAKYYNDIQKRKEEEKKKKRRDKQPVSVYDKFWLSHL